MKLTDTLQSNDWADDEFGQADFGDARLTQRLAVLARKISQTPHCSFPQALDAAALKAACRFFDNPKVDVKGVLAPHIGQTLERIRQLSVVLVPQDTSEFNRYFPLENLKAKKREKLRRQIKAKVFAASHKQIPSVLPHSNRDCLYSVRNALNLNVFNDLR
ncbi:IS4/Tn5 family transposase DNA-binding protein [Verminephrobacter eiseniae]|uniref:IS4/Tn5 family transposase DNA-binding protein n=1 Tax=Verminephrobacter eiseniae TaxID=364317 RepID=UPI0022375FE5|nr:transposase DNA-binding-containing protein [Verminephrobacter eiseniae]MCW5236628.1 hypothetical protein [Verminephrobacter eiseniae]